MSHPEQPYDPSQYYGQQQAYQGYGYQPGPGGPGAMPPQQSAPRAGFFGSLFDFSFKNFVTSRVIPVVWILWLVGIAFGTLTSVVLAFGMMTMESGFGGFAVLVISLIFGAISVLFSRIIMETLIVLFRISEDLTAIRKRGGM